MAEKHHTATMASYSKIITTLRDIYSFRLLILGRVCVHAQLPFKYQNKTVFSKQKVACEKNIKWTSRQSQANLQVVGVQLCDRLASGDTLSVPNMSCSP